ncbi:bifunctional UDP-N-acetylglucosamine diphosphorylase/glucosamine-1-phosphate N-acetyltransferase GlmU [Marininema halotolerans]|uniref:Bifunctional protein GlmU n=1 Tax=Marininema halotolerans TaxID=1155944 RepID=A0A1I6TC45_9BACL|nr:bifunctional UDP-N-acetylglucosamine diphosphorylase/glucosamine-1-phosphate N-acetyltransferase GlmU [Marininema halotolerans]SFS86779.1 bifunctional UDP-N-acetylglucosamine pyrophosphorylase / Glucosamine-1-phosphate N-acetyltransferase [Marininema halotolerans]
MRNVFAVVLAAGKGTRMKSTRHKVLHPVCGKPMIDHLTDHLTKMGVSETVVIIGHDAESIQAHLKNRVHFALQEEQLGTAHAVMQARTKLEGKDGITLVLNGDHPLFSQTTLEHVVSQHQELGSAATILTANLADPTGYGRVIRQADGSVDRVVEHKDATDEERKVSEVNTGTFCFDNQKLWRALEQVGNNNAQGEYYLPDLIAILHKEGEKIGAVTIADPNEAQGVNDRVQLAQAEKMMRQRILENHMRNGVTVIDPNHTYIDTDVVIGADTTIHPGTYLRGNTHIGSVCEVGPQVDLSNVRIADGTKISYSVVDQATLESEVTVGPFSYLRPSSHLEKGSKVGAFAEMKNARLGEGSKIPHLSYVGDADVGKHVNFSCGSITVNYDGSKKHRTVVEDDAFIGCNVNLVAPVTVGKGGFVAAGSTVTKNVPADALAVARERQTNKENYASRLKKKREGKE